MSVKKYLESISSLKNKTVILTGATSGIGKELADHLLNKEASLVVLVRNVPLMKEIKKELLKKYPTSSLEIIEYDQSSFKSIEGAIDIILDKFPDFDYFIANAGVLAPKKTLRSEEGYPLTIAINYLGVKHLLEYISPKLNNHLHRFIIAGSIAAGIKAKESYDIYNGKYNLMKQYNISKACMEAYFYHISSQNKKNNIEYVLTEPGISSTRIIRGLPLLVRFLGKYFLKIFFHSPRKASLIQLRATQDDIKNGDYVVPRGLFTLSGYPKIKKFPDKRKREFLVSK